MNKQMLLDWLVREADAKADEYYDGILKSEDGLPLPISDLLFELNGRKALELPIRIPENPDEAPQAFAGENPQYHRRVDLISLLLHHYYPEKFLFFRPSDLDFEIFSGLEFFAEIEKELEFPFHHVSRYSIKEYLKFNRTMHKLARAWWPQEESRYFKKGKLFSKPVPVYKIQNRVAYFLYQGLANLFLEKDDYNHYWLNVTNKEYFKSLDKKENVTWSGRKEMKKGDIVFTYRTKPRSAITDIYRVSDVPRFTPYGAWRGFWVELEYVSEIPDISFATMRADDELKQNPFISKSLQGSITESVSHRFYNRLLDLIPQEIKDQSGLMPEKVAKTGTSGEFSTESEFEEQVIAPLIKRWGFKYKQQPSCAFHVGGQVHITRIDFLISDGRGPITVIENKLKIMDDKMLAAARAQAKSYALMLGMSSFVVASPEGLWVYSLNKNVETLEAKITSEDLAARDAEIRSLLLKLR